MILTLANQGLSTVLMAAAVMLLLVLTVYNIRRRSTGTAQSRIDQREIDRTRQQLQTIMAEMEQIARQFAAQIDAKTSRLENLIEQADQRIAQLGGDPTAKPSGGQAAPGPADHDVLFDSAATVVDNAGDDEPDELTRNVYDLADRGEDPAAIARQLEEHIGKIELILALRRQTSQG